MALLLVVLPFLHLLPFHTEGIARGREARVGEMPFILSLRLNNYHICGATLVQAYLKTQVALTAAHSVNRPTESELHEHYRLSTLSLLGGPIGPATSRGEHPYGQKRGIRKIVIHPDFQKANNEDDIALLFLDEPFQINRLVQMARLPDPEQENERIYGNITIAGWGLTKPNQREFWDYSDTLKVVQMPIMPDYICKTLYEFKYHEKPAIHDVIFDTNFCAGQSTVVNFDDKVRIGPCRGDNGGPAFARLRNGTLYLAGVFTVAGGPKYCGSVLYPPRFAFVAYYVDWVTRNIAIDNGIIAE